MPTTMHHIDLSTEDGHQYAVMLWAAQENIRARWPVLSRLYHIENERKCTPQEAARRKRMGVKKGVPDLCLPVPRGKYHGLYIELKTLTGTPTPEQRWWIGNLSADGYCALPCYGWEQARDVLIWYLEGGVGKCPAKL